jgi:hypothetical protein
LFTARLEAKRKARVLALALCLLVLSAPANDYSGNLEVFGKHTCTPRLPAELAGARTVTWLKLSDTFSNETARARLSDAAFRAHVNGLNYVMWRESGGYLDALDIRRCLDVEDQQAAVDELVAAGFWKPEDDGGYRIIHAMDDQRTPGEVAAARERTAARVRAHRARRCRDGKHDEHCPPDCPAR